jgi:hypothetical protein
MNKYNWTADKKLCLMKNGRILSEEEYNSCFSNGLRMIKGEGSFFIGCRIINGLYEVSISGNDKSLDIYLVESEGLKEMGIGIYKYLRFDSAENAEKYLYETMKMCWDMRCFA